MTFDFVSLKWPQHVRAVSLGIHIFQELKADVSFKSVPHPAVLQLESIRKY